MYVQYLNLTEENEIKLIWRSEEITLEELQYINEMRIYSLNNHTKYYERLISEDKKFQEWIKQECKRVPQTIQ